MRKILTFVLCGKDKCTCMAENCDEKSYVYASINAYSSSTMFGLCKKHFEEFKSCVDEEYIKIKVQIEYDRKAKLEEKDEKEN